MFGWRAKGGMLCAFSAIKFWVCVNPRGTKPNRSFWRWKKSTAIDNEDCETWPLDRKWGIGRKPGHLCHAFLLAYRDIQSDNPLNGRENEESFCKWFFVIKWLRKNTSRNGKVSLKNRICIDLSKFGNRTLVYSGVKVQSHFYPGDLVTHTRDREISSVSGRLPDYPGGLAWLHLFCNRFQRSHLGSLSYQLGIKKSRSTLI